ncbi:MAG: hypothetical protein M1818_001919 [Claussenomyces sp. TS43310]|nr:MAG: hypothetical protein M1818_001919 [Claussenomyces sp. TS43310]
MAPHAHESMYRQTSYALQLDLEHLSFDGGLRDWTFQEDSMEALQVPTHPMPSMQGPFAESMLEASKASTTEPPKANQADAATRRQVLLDQDVSEDTHASKWRQRPGQRHHQLWKLIAQISFGSYLLFDGIAKDDDQVLIILQGHVDEVDAFLEGTLEDFDYAQKDIDERLRCLKIPLENIDVFDGMLEDRQFRSRILVGNEKIEHVITRTTSAMNDALEDVRQGLSATKEFAIWLAEVQENAGWSDRPETEKVYEAMKGNADGWYKAYVSLQTKGNHLGVSLVQLGSIVAEMDRRAHDVSRRPVASIASSMVHDLASDSAMIAQAVQATQYVLGRESSPHRKHNQEAEHDSPAAFTLQPRTYSPAPRSRSPRRAPAEATSPAPVNNQEAPAAEIKRRSSFKERLSLRQKGDCQSIATPSLNTSSLVRHSPNQLQTTTASQSSHSIQRPHSRAPDSVYFSDADPRNSSRTRVPSESYFTPPNPHYQSGSNYVSSPRSDQQHFRPVRASPHSPLQRPWTAAPSHAHSNLRSTSTTNLSVAESQMTTITEGGKKVKKKRSGFGWLKKAFSLSEEEKAAFEEKRRAQMPPQDYYRQERPIFLDGKRLR